MDAAFAKFPYGAVHIDNATVIRADVITSNGVIHVPDEVILPNPIRFFSHGWTPFALGKTRA